MKKLRYERPVSEVLPVDVESLMQNVSGEFNGGSDHKNPNISDGGSADDGMEAQSKGYSFGGDWDLFGSGWEAEC